jgi:hypothetical protein
MLKKQEYGWEINLFLQLLVFLALTDIEKVKADSSSILAKTCFSVGKGVSF